MENWLLGKLIFLQRKQQAVSVLELLIVIAIVAVLVAILMPSMAKVRESGRSAQCVSNQKQLAAAILLYASDNNGTLPYFGSLNDGGAWIGGSFWEDKLQPYINAILDPTKYATLGDTYLRCPSAPKGVGSTYGVNYPYIFGIENSPIFGKPKKLQSLSVKTILTTDVEGFNGFYSPWIFPFSSSSGKYGRNDSFGSVKFNFTRPRHNDRLVCSFMDGHVELVPMIDFIENKDGLWGPIPEF